MKKLLLSLALAVGVFGQISQPPAPQPGLGINTPGNSYQLQFNAAYYASKPPSFQPASAGRPGSANPNERTFFPGPSGIGEQTPRNAGSGG